MSFCTENNPSHMYVAYFERQNELHQGLKPSKSIAKPHLTVMISHNLIRFIKIRTKNALEYLRLWSVSMVLTYRQCFAVVFH